MKKTKIVATIGPSSLKVSTLTKMALAGMDVCRLNFSHSDHMWHKKAIINIREASKKSGKVLGIVADLQGPRIRVANNKSLQVKKGLKFLVTDILHANQSRRKNKIILDWDDFYQYLKPGALIFIEDGMVQLRVVKITTIGCVVQALIDGEVKPHKTVNIPTISSKMKNLTDKDLSDLEFALEQKVDAIALSFVGNRQNVLWVKKIIKHFAESKKISWLKNNPYHYKSVGIVKDSSNYKPWIISKIERRLAIKNLLSIIRESDGIMIARGDLAIEMPQEKMAILEKNILRQTRRAHKPVVVATQMLASMETNLRPTRAEISDVTNAVIDNADAVMLSGETAMGRYPIKVVETMAEIIETTEKTKYNDLRLKRNRWSNFLFGKNKGGYITKTARDLEELLKLSSLRQERLKLKMSKRKRTEWGKASLLWSVDVQTNK